MPYKNILPVIIILLFSFKEINSMEDKEDEQQAAYLVSIVMEEFKQTLENNLRDFTDSSDAQDNIRRFFSKKRKEILISTNYKYNVAIIADRKLEYIQNNYKYTKNNPTDEKKRKPKITIIMMNL